MQLLELGHKTMVYTVYTNLDLTFLICQDMCTQIAYLSHVSFITPQSTLWGVISYPRSTFEYTNIQALLKKVIFHASIVSKCQ